MMKATEFLPQTFDPNIFARYFKLWILLDQIIVWNIKGGKYKGIRKF